MATPAKLDLFDLIKSNEPSTKAATELAARVRATRGFLVANLDSGGYRVTNRDTGRYSDLPAALTEEDARKALTRLRATCGWTPELLNRKKGQPKNETQTETGQAAKRAKARVGAVTTTRVRPALPDITSEVVWCGPEMAAEWLATVPSYQRKLAMWWAKYLGSIMRRPGEYTLTNESIAFDENGGLLDGMHRAMGVVLANEAGGEYIEVPFLVTRGWPVEVFAKIGRGKRRTTGDTLYGQGEKDTAILGTTLRTLIQLQDVPRLDWSSTRITDDQILQKLEANPEIRASVGFARRVYSSTKLQVPAGAILHRLAADATDGDHRPVEAWLRQLQTGEYIGKGDPVYTIREWLRRAQERNDGRIQTARMTMAQLHLFLICKAWNATVEEKSYAQVSWEDRSTPPAPLPWPTDRPLPGSR